MIRVGTRRRIGLLVVACALVWRPIALGAVVRREPRDAAAYFDQGVKDDG